MIVPAILVSLTFACAPKPSEEALLAEYQDAVKSYQAEIDSLMAEYNPQDEQNAAMTEAKYDEITAKMVDLSVGTMKANKGNKVAVEALKTAYYDLEDEQIEETLSEIPEETFQLDERLQKMREAVKARKATAEGLKFTDFTVKSVVAIGKDGNQTLEAKKLSDFVGKGKCVLVDFWASWCGPCKREIPNIAKVYADFAGEKFDVLSIAVWDKAPATFKAAAEHGVVWNQIVCSEDDASVPTDVYGIEGIPQIILFGPDGTILNRDLRGEGIADAVKTALGL